MKKGQLTIFFLCEAELLGGYGEFLCRRAPSPQGLPPVYNTWNGYVKAGHKIHIFTQSYDYDEYSDWEYNDWQLHNVPSPFKYLRKKRFTKLGKFLLRISRLIGLYRVWRRALAVAKENPPDVVYSYSPWNGLPAMYIARKYNAVHVVRRFGSSLYDVLTGKHYMWRNDGWIIEVFTYRLYYDLVIMTNDGTFGDKVSLHYGCPASKLVFWTNGIDKTMYNPDCDRVQFRKELGLPEDCPIVLSVARLAGMKRVDHVIEVMKYVTKARPDARLVIVGDGVDEEKLRQLTHDYGLDDVVLFVGAVAHSEIKNYFNASDVYVQLFDRSNRSNPLFEAMCCSLPIVTFEGPSTGDLIFHGKTALCVQSNMIFHEKPVSCVEAEELEKAADYVASLLNDKELRLTLGKNARQHLIDNFQTWEERIKMEIDVVYGLVQTRKK